MQQRNTVSTSVCSISTYNRISCFSYYRVLSVYLGRKTKEAKQKCNNWRGKAVSDRVQIEDSTNASWQHSFSSIHIYHIHPNFGPSSQMSCSSLPGAKTVAKTSSARSIKSSVNCDWYFIDIKILGLREDTSNGKNSYFVGNFIAPQHN